MSKLIEFFYTVKYHKILNSYVDLLVFIIPNEENHALENHKIGKVGTRSMTS